MKSFCDAVRGAGCGRRGHDDRDGRRMPRLTGRAVMKVTMRMTSPLGQVVVA